MRKLIPGPECANYGVFEQIFVGDDVTKHEHRGHHALANSLIQHLHDRLDERRREAHGYQKSATKDGPPMTSHTEFVRDVVKQYGIVALAKSMVKDQKAYGLDEHTFTQLATEHAARLYPNDRPDSAFSKLYESEESVRRAMQISKSTMPYVVDPEPLVVSGERARGGDVNVDDPAEAIAHLKELGRRRWPTASEAEQFANALTDPDPVNRKLAARAHVRPSPMTSYPFPR
jgi:hypothetical protein